MKKISFCSVVVLLMVLINANGVGYCKADGFNDIAGNEYYAEAAMSLAEKGILSGYDDGSFGAEKSITRAEMVTIICRMSKLIEEIDTGSNTFSDVSSHWAAGYVNAATKKNIINGYDDGTFKPSENITREEFVQILTQAFGFEPVRNIKPGFDDVDENA